MTALAREPSQTPSEIRTAARAGHAVMTSGLAPGYLQGNLVVLPSDWADEFAGFCQANPGPLPLLAIGSPGDPYFPMLGTDVDVRRDLGGYQLWSKGALADDAADLLSWWQADDVAFVLGCWFSQEAALAAAGVRMRHIELGIQGGLFRTHEPCRPAGRFRGSLVVSARPFADEHVATVARITGALPQGHGAPVHTGDPGVLGISDITRPEFGESLPPLPGETLMYWGCGLTANEALRIAGVPRYATHRAGCMLLTDIPTTFSYRGTCNELRT